jgi:hypothetical protein
MCSYYSLLSICLYDCCLFNAIDKQDEEFDILDDIDFTCAGTSIGLMQLKLKKFFDFKRYGYY